MEFTLKKMISKWRKLNNKGITLVELICAIAIMVVLASAVASIMIVSAKAYSAGSVEAELQQEAQLLSNQIERLVQFASDATAVSTSELKITEGASGNVYTLKLDTSTNTVEYTDETTGSTAPMANDVEELVFDTSDFADDGVVKMFVKAKRGDNEFSGNFTISSRNISKSNNIPGGDITMTLTEAYVLEPNQTQPLSAQMSDGSGIDWALTGNTDATTLLSDDPTTGKKTISIGNDEDANIVYLTASSQRKMADGSTPLIEKTIPVYIRRVTEVSLDFTNDKYGDKRKTVKNGDMYTITATGTGTNLDDMTSVIGYSDPGYVKEDGSDGLYKTVSPKDIYWNVKVYIKNELKTDKNLDRNYDDAFISCQPTESVIGGTPNLKLKLKFDLDAGDQILVTAKAKHPLGGIERRDASNNLYTEQTNLVTLPYDSVDKVWILYKDVYKYNGNGFARASDDPQGDIYVDTIINILRAYYGNDKVNQEAWNSDKIFRSHRFREVVLAEDGETIISHGMWTNWRYLGNGTQQDRGSSLNMRPAASRSLDCDKAYQVQLRLFVLDHEGNEVYPIPGVTDESEYLITGIVNPVTFYMNATYTGPEYNWGTQYLFYNSIGGSCEAPAGVDISVNRKDVKYIKNDQENVYTRFTIQRQNESGVWENVKTFSDYNNFNDPDSIYLQMNGGNTDSINKMAFQRKGNYRVMLSHVEVPYTKYVPATDTYEGPVGKKDYQYYDEESGRGIYYFSVSENSLEWKKKFIEFAGKIYPAKDYFVCEGKLYEKSKLSYKDHWVGSGSQVMYYTNSGTKGEMFVALDGVTFEKHSYSYKGSDPKTFTYDGKTLKSKDEMNKSGIPEVVKDLIKEKLGWW